MTNVRGDLQRTFRLFPVLRLNLSKSGVSASIRGPGVFERTPA
jgi:hypothetical protein